LIEATRPQPAPHRHTSWRPEPCLTGIDVLLQLGSDLSGLQWLRAVDVRFPELAGMHRCRDAGASRKNLDGVSEPESLGDHDEVDGRPSRAAGVAAPAFFAVAADEHRHRGRLPGLGTVARGGAWPR